MQNWLPPSQDAGPFVGADRLAPLPPSKPWPWWRRIIYRLGHRIEYWGRIVQGWGS